MGNKETQQKVYVAGNCDMTGIEIIHSPEGVVLTISFFDEELDAYLNDEYTFTHEVFERFRVGMNIIHDNVENSLTND
jgi:hypothetical protein